MNFGPKTLCYIAWRLQEPLSFQLTKAYAGAFVRLPRERLLRLKRSSVENGQKTLAVPGGLEPPTNGLGNRCSVLLSYGTAVGRSGRVGGEPA